MVVSEFVRQMVSVDFFSFEFVSPAGGLLFAALVSPVRE